MGQHLRVVVADDEPPVRDLVVQWLRQLGHEIIVVADGAELVAACRRERPDLVVSDVRVPGLDGLAAAEVLRGEMALPIILLSGGWTPDQVARAERLGVPHLVKPVRPLDLLTAIAGVCPAGGRFCRSAGDAHFRQLVETVDGVAIFTIDPAGRVTHWNRGAERLFGYANGEILGHNWDCIFTPADRAAGVPARELVTAAAAGKAEDERWHTRKSGGEFWAHGVVAPLRGPGGRLIGYGKIVRDRTDLKEREVALLAHADALRAADERRAALLATVAHELRNPLAPLLSYAQLLGLTSADPAVRDVAAKIERQVRLLDRLVEDLVEAARVCQGKVSLNREWVDLRAVVRQAADTTAPRCQSAGHELSVCVPDGPVWLDGDPARLGQVVVNLLTNAVKYTPEPGRIAVVVEQANGHATVRVRDTGVGIAADKLAAVFDLFAQDDRHRAYAQGGLGVGLAVVRELVARHGGSVHAASDGDGRGSEFVVRLPLPR